MLDANFRFPLSRKDNKIDINATGLLLLSFPCKIQKQDHTIEINVRAVGVSASFVFNVKFVNLLIQLFDSKINTNFQIEKYSKKLFK